MDELVLYNNAKRALAEARSVDEIKDIRDKAKAIKYYAMQANDKTLLADSAELVFRAECALHDLLQEQKIAGLIQKRTGRPQAPDTVGENGFRQNPLIPATLESQGIDKNLAHSTRKAGKIPKEKREDEIARLREEAQRKTRILAGEGEISRRIFKHAMDSLIHISENIHLQNPDALRVLRGTCLSTIKAIDEALEKKKIVWLASR